MARTESRPWYHDENGGMESTASWCRSATSVLYDFVTPICPVASVERLVIGGSVILSTWLLFDRSRWPEVMQELQRRAA
jgi:hypothetical protein